MDAGSRNDMKQQGVSIITCTNRQGFLGNLIGNYIRQNHSKKELVIIVNDNKTPLAPYKLLAQKHRNIKVFRKPGHCSLGACLNYAVKKTKYSYIAKFDDDDYYAPYYLKDCLQVFQRTQADVIGKRSHYMYLRGSQKLILRFPNEEFRPADKLPGATLVFKRKVFNKVRFPNQNVGEDDLFCLRSRGKGYRVYSGGKYNFAAIRRKNSSGHTWIISDQELLAHHKVIPNVKNYKRFVQRKAQGD